MSPSKWLRKHGFVARTQPYAVFRFFTHDSAMIRCISGDWSATVYRDTGAAEWGWSSTTAHGQHPRVAMARAVALSMRPGPDDFLKELDQ